MTTAAGTATAEKKPAKRKVASKPKEPGTPRLKPYVDRPFSEVLHVPLTPADFLRKTHIMLQVSREKENLEAEFESAKAAYKQKIKVKQEEITEIQGELQSNSEKRDVALIARLYPAKKSKNIIDAATGKVVRKGEPMTRTEVLEATSVQNDLITVPPSPKPDPAVPVNQPTPKDGDKPADPDRTNPAKVEDVNVEQGPVSTAEILTTNQEGRVVKPNEPAPKKRKRGGTQVYVPPKDTANEPKPSPITKDSDDEYTPF